ncbi:MAG: N-acetylmuramoyl-L-alanine amidase [Leadbetterella sp.]|nr:N-acetylmuramoyl-L-alanine amidase [Leadbetterella sp.]
MGLILFSTSCITGKYAPAEKIYRKKVKAMGKQLTERPASSQLDKINWSDKLWAATTNMSIRKPNYVVIHHTAQNSTDQTIRTFQLERTAVSSHYVIGRDGKVVQMVNDYVRAQHAGVGRWGNDTDLNSSSIGIEMDNNGTTDPWPEVQINALIELLKVLKETHRIPQGNFIGHADYAPNRKVDPFRFPWKQLAGEGFGYWYDEEPETPPASFDPVLALRIIGYDISNLNNAIRAFKIHYIQDESPVSMLRESDIKVLYSIFKKYL